MPPLLAGGVDVDMDRQLRRAGIGSGLRLHGNRRVPCGMGRYDPSWLTDTTFVSELVYCSFTDPYFTFAFRVKGFASSAMS